MKRALAALGLCLAVSAWGQTTPPKQPTPTSAWLSTTGAPGSWFPMLITGSSATPVPGVPTPAGLYCSNDGTGNPGTWVPCTGTGGGGGGGTSVTLQQVASAPGTLTFAHNLNSTEYFSHCTTSSGGVRGPATWSDYPIDANDAAVVVPSAGTYVCSFQSATAIAPDFSVSASPASQTYQPTMTGTQQPTYTITQSIVGGYSGTATYSTSGLAAGMTGAFSPTTITGSGTNTLTLSFPANQTPATTTFTATGTDGTKTHSTSPAITVGTINSGLVECWAMTDGSGSSLADSCGTSNTETLGTGSFTWASHSGLPGTTPAFSATAYTVGTNQTATNFDGSSPFSVSVWVNLAGASSTRAVMSTLNTAAQDVGWELLVGASGANFTMSSLLVNNFGSNNYTQQTTTTTFTGGALHFLTMVYDGTKSTTSVTFYIDGVAATAPASSKTLTGSLANTKPLSIGGRTDGTLPINGTMAYLRIYNRALSSGDVAAYFAAGAR